MSSPSLFFPPVQENCNLYIYCTFIDGRIRRQKILKPKAWDNGTHLVADKNNFRSLCHVILRAPYESPKPFYTHGHIWYFHGHPSCMDAMHDVARGDVDMMDGHDFNFTRRKKSIGGTVMTHQILFRYAASTSTSNYLDFRTCENSFKYWRLQIIENI